MTAFAPPLSRLLGPSAPRVTQSRPHVRPCVAPRRRATMRQSAAESEATDTTSVGDLKQRLQSALVGLNRGLSIDADSTTADEREAAVEDLIEQIEDANACAVPVRDARMFGEWDLAYTSSSITRYFGGATGLQRLLPQGEVGRIVQYIDPEDGTSEFRESLSFELPVVGTAMQAVAVANGKIRATGEARQAWDPEYVKFYFFKQFADGWKTLRAFQIADTTFLDETMRITRGQTGSVNVFVKVDDET